MEEHKLETFWQRQCRKSLEKQLYRAIHLARTNIDYQLEYPSEVRANPEGKVLLECHPEAKKRIMEKHEKCLKLAIVPSVKRPERLNRVG